MPRSCRHISNYENEILELEAKGYLNTSTFTTIIAFKQNNTDSA